ncbi:hypothetical protein VNO78_19798 [Psophocarpus tetragonolobus]|uniref:Low-temperature-induced 65 kDa protein n=1 Tax=Psophocarpus tetragonolobus TaxID=3891 RepID=A0AAN9S8R1_PSOTE
MDEEPRHSALLGGVSSTTEIDPNIVTDLAKTFSVEEKAGLTKDNLGRSIGLEGQPRAPSKPEAYSPPNYQTNVSDLSDIGKDEIEITPLEESFAKMNVHDEPKPTPEKIFQPTAVDSEYPPVGSHDQFVPHLSAATQTQIPFAEIHDQFNEETVSSNINRNLENPTETGQSLNTITAAVEEQPHYEASTDAVVSPKDVMVSEIGSGEKDDIEDKVVTNEEQQKSGVPSNMSSSTAQYGKNIAHTLSEKLAPAYDKVAGVGSAVKSKVTGISTDGVGTEAKNGVSVKDYLAEKLRPGEEDKTLSKVISEALHKNKEEPVKNEDGNLDDRDEKVREESCVNSSGKGMVHKLKGVVGYWFGKSEDKGDEDLSKNTISGAEVDQDNKVVGEIKSSPVEEQ